MSGVFFIPLVPKKICFEVGQKKIYRLSFLFFENYKQKEK